MGRKIVKHIIPFFVVFVFLCGVFCPSLYKAATVDLITTFSSGKNVSGSINPSSNRVIPSTVYSYDDYYAEGTLYSNYTVYDFYHIVGESKTTTNYSGIQFDINSLNFVINSFKNITSYKLVFGTYEEIVTGNYRLVYAIDGTISYGITDYECTSLSEMGKGEVFFAFVFTGYSYSVSDSISTSNPSYNLNYSGDIDVYGLDIYGAFDYMYHYLTEMYYQNEDILSNLDKICNNTDTVETKLSSLLTYIQNNYSKLSSIDTRVSNIYTQLTQIYSKLDSINTGIGDINTELNTQTGILGSINSGLSNFYNKFLEYAGLNDNTPAPSTPNTSGVSSSIQMEQNLLNKDTSGAVNNLNITVDIAANSSIWDLITRALNTHAAVFGGFITLLSIGVIKLFFGR